MNEAQQNKTYEKQIKSHRGQNKLSNRIFRRKQKQQAGSITGEDAVQNRNHAWMEGREPLSSTEGGDTLGRLIQETPPPTGEP